MGVCFGILLIMSVNLFIMSGSGKGRRVGGDSKELEEKEEII